MLNAARRILPLYKTADILKSDRKYYLSTQAPNTFNGSILQMVESSPAEDFIIFYEREAFKKFNDSWKAHNAVR